MLPSEPFEPRWRGTRLPSGLIIASSDPAGEPEVPVPKELRSQEPVIVLPSSAAPEPHDMLGAAPTPEDLNLPTPTLDDVLEVLSELPFEHAMLITSILAAEVFHHGTDHQRLLRYAADILPPQIVQRIARFVGEEESSRRVFDPRFLLALQRVLIVYAAPDPQPARDLTPTEAQYLGGALLGLAGALPRVELPEPQEGDDPDWYSWMSFFAQSGAWYDEPYIVEAVARAHASFADIASSAELADHHARTEVDDRLTTIYGLNLSEQLGVGLACAALTKAVDDDIEPGERAVHLARGFLANGTLADRESDAVTLVSATRDQLREALVASGNEPEQIAWDHSVLERWPLIRLPGDRLRLLSPRALVAWMTRGFHYRLLDGAGAGLTGRDAHDARGRFLTFTGAIGEAYVQRLVSTSLRNAAAAGAVRIHGEKEYHVSGQRLDGPDVVIDAGPDLVMLEVYSGRMSLQARTDASSDALEEYVQRAVSEKLVELANRIRDLLARRLRYENVDLSVVRRISPVLVLAGDAITPNPLLWGHLKDSCTEGFVQDARVQPPVICGLDDLEALLALTEEGKHLPELIAAFLNSGAEEFPPRNWVGQVYGFERRPSFVEDQFDRANEVVRLLAVRHEGRRKR